MVHHHPGDILVVTMASLGWNPKANEVDALESEDVDPALVAWSSEMMENSWDQKNRFGLSRVYIYIYNKWHYNSNSTRMYMTKIQLLIV